MIEANYNINIGIIKTYSSSFVNKRERSDFGDYTLGKPLPQELS